MRRSRLPEIRRCTYSPLGKIRSYAIPARSLAVIADIESKYDSRTRTPYFFSKPLTSAGSTYSE